VGLGLFGRSGIFDHPTFANSISLYPMGNYVVKVPENLRWSNFITRPGKIRDPNDSKLVDAYTTFGYVLPSTMKPYKVGGKTGLALPEKWVITITPKAQVWKDATKSDDLLAHEEWHYFLGFVLARALVTDLLALRVDRQNQLVGAFNKVADLHFITRAKDLNIAYDDATGHGTLATKQAQWLKFMADCIADPSATELGGLPL
jgi:hypothetical protein